MNIPDEAKNTVPFGYEIKVGDGVWVKPKGSLCWTKDSPTWDSVVTCGLNSASGFIYALPATLDGYELVKVGEVIPDGSMSMVKGNPKCFGTSFCTGHAVKKNDGNWHFRPIAAPVAEPVKCPYCGSGMYKRGKWFVCKNDKCVYCSPTCETEAAALALVKRTRVEPEPLRRPVPGCGEATGTRHIGYPHGLSGYQTECLRCHISGPARETSAEAESEFRKLAYGGAK